MHSILFLHSTCKECELCFISIGTILVLQLTTIDRSKIISKLGHIPEDSGVIELVDKAVAKQLGIKIS